MKVLNAPGYPARIPKPHRPDLYEVRSTSDMGIGVFAKRDINRGELIFSERPLLVTPTRYRPSSRSEIPPHYTAMQINQILMFEHEQVLKAAIDRMSEEDRARYMSLCNSHHEDGSGPIFGIMRTNGYRLGLLYDGSDKSSDYGAVCDLGSRLNHRWSSFFLLHPICH